MILKQHPQDLVLFFHFPPSPQYGWSIFSHRSKMFYIVHDNLCIVNDDDIYRQLAKSMSLLERMDILTSHVKGQKHELHDGDKLFFHTSCTLPRSLLKGRLKESAQENHCDAVVIPMPVPIEYNPHVSIFRSSMIDGRNVSIIFEDPVSTDNGKELAEKIEQEYQWTPEEHLMLLQDAKHIHTGMMIGYSNYDSFIPDVIDNKYKHVVTEHDIISFLAGKDEFTIDNVRQLITMAESPDIESKELCLRTLAAMDYASYPFTARQIIATATGRKDYDLQISDAVSYMYNELSRIHSKYFRKKEADLVDQLYKTKIFKHDNTWL